MQNDDNHVEESESSDFQALESTAAEMHVDAGQQVRTKSLCTQCGKQGTTKMVIVNIPKFNETSISSFKCRNCGFFGRDVQQLTDIQNFGIDLSLQVKCARDLARGVVKSSNCAAAVPEIGLEIEARPMSGVYTTVEGLIRQVADNLEMLQPERRLQDAVTAQKIDDFIAKIREILQKTMNQDKPTDQTIFTLNLNDPAGNSFIEPFQDLPHLTKKNYPRTVQQAESLGLTEQQEKQIQREAKAAVVDTRVVDDIMLDNSQIQAEFPSPCPMCGCEIMNKNLIINIPYFKECILMAAHCDECGYRTVEVGAAGAIPMKGRITRLHVTDPSDLSREVLKSHSCSVKLIELGVELQAGTLGGIYTTLEGLVVQIKDELKHHSQFWLGDASRDDQTAKNWKVVIEKLENYAKGLENFTIEIDDPLDGSFIKNVYAPEPDPEMQVTEYERTPEQNEELGLVGVDAGDD